MLTYPVYIILEGRDVLVVGGGDVALRKIESLLEAGARVKAVALDVDERISALAKARPELTVEIRGYLKGEAARYFLIVAATNSEETNKAVASDAAEAGRLVNVVDQPELCNFIVPSVFRRGDLSVAISTGGASPALSRRIRQRLEAAFPERFAVLVELLAELRSELQRTVPDFEERGE